MTAICAKVSPAWKFFAGRTERYSYWTITVVDASLKPPETVVQWRRYGVVLVAGRVVAVPFTLVLLRFCEVNVASVGEEMTQVFMPEVTHPMSDVCPVEIFAGFATRMMVGFEICTEHCAPEVTAPLVHVSA